MSRLSVLMVSGDPRVAKPQSSVARRMVSYGRHVGRLDIVTAAPCLSSEGVIRLSDTVFVHTSSARSKFGARISALRNAMRISRPDIVTVQDPFELGVIAALIARRFHVPFQVQIHTDFLSPWYRAESSKNKIRVFLARFVISRASGVRVVSERIKRSLVSEFAVPAERIRVLPIAPVSDAGIPLKPSRTPGPDSQFDYMVLTVARLSKEKNISFAIRAFAEFHATHPRAGFLIIGDGPERHALLSLSQKIGIADAVVFARWIEDPILYYPAADAYLSSSRYEGYGLSLVEAARAGTPIATTDVGVVGDGLAGEGVCVYPHDDVAAAARCLGDFYEKRPHSAPPALMNEKEYAAKVVEGWRSSVGL